MNIFEKWLYEIENVNFYAKIDTKKKKKKIAQADENALRDLNYTKSLKKKRTYIYWCKK